MGSPGNTHCQKRSHPIGSGQSQFVNPFLLKMKLILFVILTVFHCQNTYKIVTLPRLEDQEHSMKVFFKTKTVSLTHTVTETTTQTAFETCYASEPGITPCHQKRDDEELEPIVELNGQSTSWESIISPSRTTRVEREIGEEEEVVEIVEPSQNVQVITSDLGEPAAVVYPTIVHQSREAEESNVEVEYEDNEVSEPFHDELESAEVRHHEHEEIDNADDHVNDFEDEEKDDMVTTEMASDETTTFEPEMTTIMEEFEEEANPARENLDAPILLDSSWEEREVVIEQSINTECMDMKNDLFINVMSTVISTMTEYETTTVNGLNSVLFKSEGGCLPSNVNEMFSSSCV